LRQIEKLPVLFEVADHAKRNGISLSALQMVETTIGQMPGKPRIKVIRLKPIARTEAKTLYDERNRLAMVDQSGPGIMADTLEKL
jgi:hypothetical protein